MNIRTVYLKSVFEPALFQETFDKTVTAARVLRTEVEFDTLAFCGMSGAAMAFVLGLTMNLPTLCVRKERDNAHYRRYKSSPLEGNVGVRRYLIVDDFISSGSTVNYIIRCINSELPSADCAAILLYAEPSRSYGHPHPEEDRSIRIVSSRPGDE